MGCFISAAGNNRDQSRQNTSRELVTVLYSSGDRKHSSVWASLSVKRQKKYLGVLQLPFAFTVRHFCAHGLAISLWSHAALCVSLSGSCNAGGLKKEHLWGQCCPGIQSRGAFHQQAIAFLEAVGEESMHKPSCFLYHAPFLSFLGDLWASKCWMNTNNSYTFLASECFALPGFIRIDKSRQRGPPENGLLGQHSGPQLGTVGSDFISPPKQSRVGPVCCFSGRPLRRTWVLQDMVSSVLWVMLSLERNEPILQAAVLLKQHHWGRCKAQLNWGWKADGINKTRSVFSEVFRKVREELAIDFQGDLGS